MKKKQIILLAVLLGVLICAMVLTLIDYPRGIKAYFPYILACMFLVAVTMNIYTGRQKIKAARSNGEKINWYEQSSITVGLMLLMIGLFDVIGIGIGRNLPNTQGDIFLYICLVVFGIPLIIFFVLTVRASRTEQGKLRDQQSKVKSGIIKNDY